MTFIDADHQTRVIRHLRAERRTIAAKTLKARKTLATLRNAPEKDWCRIDRVQDGLWEAEYLVKQLTLEIGQALSAVPGKVQKVREFDGGKSWKVYPADVSMTTIETDFVLEGSVHNLGCEGCPGQPFSYDAEIRRTGTRTLVKKEWALDI